MAAEVRGEHGGGRRARCVNIVHRLTGKHIMTSELVRPVVLNGADEIAPDTFRSGCLSLLGSEGIGFDARVPFWSPPLPNLYHPADIARIVPFRLSYGLFTIKRYTVLRVRQPFPDAPLIPPKPPRQLISHPAIEPVPQGLSYYSQHSLHSSYI